MKWQDVIHDCWWYYNLCPDNPPDPRGFVGQAAGGSLHIVLDDGNYEDDSVDFCIKYALEHNDEHGLKLAQKIRCLSLLQRGRLSRQKYHLYCYGAPEPTK